MAPQPFDGIVWRVTWASRDPLVGGTGGGRWSIPNDFEVLYTSLDENGAMAEAYHHLTRAPVFSTSHVNLNELDVQTGRILVFGDIGALRPVGIDEEQFRRGDPSRTREIGAAARFLDMDGLIVPSARWPCTNLVLFLDRMPDASLPTLADSRDVNWPAWREDVGRPGAGG